MNDSVDDFPVGARVWIKPNGFKKEYWGNDWGTVMPIKKYMGAYEYVEVLPDHHRPPNKCTRGCAGSMKSSASAGYPPKSLVLIADDLEGITYYET